MPFAFGFSGDDIDALEDDSRLAGPTGGVGQIVVAASSKDTSATVPNVSHPIGQWLSTLPSSIAYSTIEIESPTGKVLRVPKRELFDVRQQLMAEDDESTLNDLETSDLRSNVYEGGFKTWECSIDLASLLLEDIDQLARADTIIELGAGSALPTLVLFQHALQTSYPIAFTLADFNDRVLRLVTLPNMLLTWARHNEPVAIPADRESGELEVTAELVAGFTSALAQIGITINFLSGPWSPALLDLVPASASDLGTLVLAAETIYSPASTVAFVDLVAQLLKRTPAPMAKALVAAKRMYFGIGGSVDGLKEVCRGMGARAVEIDSGVPGMDQGVGRALVEIQLA